MTGHHTSREERSRPRRRDFDRAININPNFLGGLLHYPRNPSFSAAITTRGIAN